MSCDEQGNGSEDFKTEGLDSLQQEPERTGHAPDDGTIQSEQLKTQGSSGGVRGQVEPTVDGKSNLGIPESPELIVADIVVQNEEPRWLHPSSLLFGTLSHAKQLVIPVLLAVFSAAKGSQFGLWVAAIIFAISLMVTLFRYLTLRYQLKEGDLIVKEGFIFRRVRTVPIRRIQNMDLVQNVLHRLFGVAEVKIETASGTEPEAVLRVLTMAQMERLREEVFGSRRSTDVGATESENDNVHQLSDHPQTRDQVESTTLLRIPTAWLVKAGLASNRGTIILGVFVGFLFQFDLEEYVDWKLIRNNIPNFEGSVQNILLTIVGVTLIFLFLKLFGVVWYILRFYGYELQRVGEDLRIRCGLFTKVSATVPRKRIQFISIHRPLFLRWMGMSVVRIETAGGAGTGNEDAATSVSRRWFIPVIKQELVDGILTELRPGLEWDQAAVDWKGLSQRAPARMRRLAVIASMLLMIGGFFAWRPWGGIFGVVLIPVFIQFANRRSRSMKYARTGFGVVYRSGIMTKKLSLTFFERIQALRVSQSPFDRRWKMARLIVDTAAAGPAEHQINVGYLDEQFARDEFADLKQTASKHRPNWK